MDAGMHRARIDLYLTDVIDRDRGNGGAYARLSFKDDNGNGITMFVEDPAALAEMAHVLALAAQAIAEKRNARPWNAAPASSPTAPRMTLVTPPRVSVGPLSDTALRASLLEVT